MYELSAQQRQVRDIDELVPPAMFCPSREGLCPLRALFTEGDADECWGSKER